MEEEKFKLSEAKGNIPFHFIPFTQPECNFHDSIVPIDLSFHFIVKRQAEGRKEKLQSIRISGSASEIQLVI